MPDYRISRKHEAVIEPLENFDLALFNVLVKDKHNPLIKRAENIIRQNHSLLATKADSLRTLVEYLLRARLNF